MKTSLIFLTCLMALSEAQRGGKLDFNPDQNMTGTCLFTKPAPLYKHGECELSGKHYNFNVENGYIAYPTGQDFCCCRCCNTSGDCGVARCRFW